MNFEVGSWLNDLKWNSHNIISQAEPKLCILKYHRFNFTKLAVKTMYTAFIRPILEYASTVGCNATQRDLTRLEDINLSSLRCISGAKIGISHSALYADTGLDSLRNRQIPAQLVNAFDAKHENRLCRLGDDNFVSLWTKGKPLRSQNYH